LVRKLEGRDCLEDLGVDERSVSEVILGQYCEKLWTGLIWLRIRVIDRLL